MNTSPLPADSRLADPLQRFDQPTAIHTSGVSWGAILAGAAGAAALSLILLILGTGLGFSAVSPWTGQGASAAAVGLSTVLWLTFTQLAASGMGGYLAGRLRTKWASVPSDEVYFRDTAHGFLAWAVATLATATLLTASIASIVGSGVQAGASVAGAAASTGALAAGVAAGGSKDSTGSGSDATGMGYFVDSLFRKDLNAPAAASAASAASSAGVQAASDMNSASTVAEVSRIFVNDLRSGVLPPEDVQYVGQVVAQRTGISQAEAEKRVSDTFAKIQTKLKDAEATARDTADKARKGTAYAALWLFVSLLAGAFIASLMATFGGRRRDI